jgi:hypothetical protein
MRNGKSETEDLFNVDSNNNGIRVNDMGNVSIKHSEKYRTIRKVPGLTRDNSLYIGDAFASLSKNSVFINIILPYSSISSPGTYARIYDFHKYPKSSINAELLQDNYYPTYVNVPAYRCLFISPNDQTKFVTKVTSHPCPEPKSGRATGYLSCELPHSMALKLSNFQELKLYLVSKYILTSPNSPHDHEGVLLTDNDGIKYEALMEFILTHPSKKINIDPKYSKIPLNSQHNDKLFDAIIALSPISIAKLPYLAEWIEFHLLVGIKHFIIYTSESEPERLIEMQDYLKVYIEKHIVTFVKFSFAITEYSSSFQMPAYMDASFRSLDFSVWLFNIDSDEYLVPMNSEASLTPILQNYAKMTKIIEMRIAHVAFELESNNTMWKCDDKKETQLIMEKYQFRDEPTHTSKTKYAGRLGFFSHSAVHYLNSGKPGPDIALVDPKTEIRLHHYYSSQRQRDFILKKHVPVRDGYAWKTFGAELKKRVEKFRENTHSWC